MKFTKMHGCGNDYVYVNGFEENIADEAKAAIAKIMEGAETVELEPQPQHIRKLQHEYVDAHNLASKSEGEGVSRHLRIFREKD